MPALSAGGVNPPLRIQFPQPLRQNHFDPPRGHVNAPANLFREWNQQLTFWRLHDQQRCPGRVRTGELHIAHNASSNLKLASGIARVADLDAAGVNVCLGTDGAASNNRQDMFEEIRQAALLAKGSTGQPTVLPARRALEMATLHGAKALGREADLGTLSVGKLADVIAVDLSSPECRPVYHPDAQLAYVAAREHVSDVWVNGEQVLRKRVLTKFDLSAVMAEVEDTVARMKAEA